MVCGFEDNRQMLKGIVTGEGPNITAKYHLPLLQTNNSDVMVTVPALLSAKQSFTEQSLGVGALLDLQLSWNRT